jgi:hypothetical protein
MNFQTELETLIRARYPILYVISSEEMRVQNVIVEIAAKRQKKVFEWSYSTGIVPAGTSIQSHKNRNAATKDPLLALDQVIEQVEPAILSSRIFIRSSPRIISPSSASSRKSRCTEEQFQNDRAHLAGDGNSHGAGKGNHRAELSAARRARI